MEQHILGGILEKQRRNDWTFHNKRIDLFTIWTLLSLGSSTQNSNQEPVFDVIFRLDSAFATTTDTEFAAGCFSIRTIFTGRECGRV
jgi:hypothetical protein